VLEEIPLYLFCISLDKTMDRLSATIYSFGSTLNVIWVITISSWTWWDWSRWWRIGVAASSSKSQAEHEGQNNDTCNYTNNDVLFLVGLSVPIIIAAMSSNFWKDFVG
jgi:hypothetical protein